MKTIEERAAHIAQEFGATKSNKERAIYRACIRMATEQKAIDDKLYEDALQTTHTPKGVTKKELLELLINYPDDAIVVVECCNVRKLSYNQKDNTIRID